MKTEDRLKELQYRMDKIDSSIRELTDFITEYKSNLIGKKTNLVDDTHYDEYHGIPDNLRHKIESIMEDFDFDKIHKVMDFLGWTWYSETSVPSVQRLKETAKDMLIRAVREKCNIGSGGFKAIFESDGPYDDDPYVGLEFILEDMEGFDEVADDDDDDEDEENE